MACQHVFRRRITLSFSFFSGTGTPAKIEEAYHYEECCLDQEGIIEWS